MPVTDIQIRVFSMKLYFLSNLKKNFLSTFNFVPKLNEFLSKISPHFTQLCKTYTILNI